MNMHEVIARSRRDTGEFCFEASEPVFAGHFPGHPILPGVFQLEMVRQAAQEIVRQPVIIRAVRKAKFQRPIQPGETVRVQLNVGEDGDGFVALARLFVGEQAAGETQLLLGRV